MRRALISVARKALAWLESPLRDVQIRELLAVVPPQPKVYVEPRKPKALQAITYELRCNPLAQVRTRLITHNGGESWEVLDTKVIK